MEPSLNRVFGRNVNRVRMARGLTQEDLLRVAGISRRHLQNIEAGRKEPGLKIIVGLAVATKASWEVLMADLRDQFPSAPKTGQDGSDTEREA